MIVRRLADGTLRLITQIDHAKLSGLFAAHWGNDEFEPPQPFESVVRGTIYHDVGWLRYEALPRYEPARHWSPTFFEVPSDEEQLAAFQWGIDWMTAIDPYAGLMVSRHRTGLWRNRYDALTHPRMGGGRVHSAAIEQFVARNEATQAQMLAGIDAARFATNFGLLQVWDLLSLYLCTADPKVEHIEPVPCNSSGSHVRLDLKPIGPDRIEISPYPFDTRPLRVSVVCREVDGAPLDSEAAFRSAFFAAPPKVLAFDFV